MKLLSTMEEVRFEDVNAQVLGRIKRTGQGNDAILIGERPLRAHYQVVRYFTGEEQRGFVVPKAARPEVAALPDRAGNDERARREPGAPAPEATPANVIPLEAS
jgi:hypothetical protein